nr:AT hook motif protein [uncultured bacterium]
MNNAGHLPISETARRVGKVKAKRGRPRKNAVRATTERELPAAGTLTRTKSLLLAALRVWELKHRITD